MMKGYILEVGTSFNPDQPLLSIGQSASEFDDLTPAGFNALVVKLKPAPYFQRENLFALQVVEGKDHAS